MIDEVAWFIAGDVPTKIDVVLAYFLVIAAFVLAVVLLSIAMSVVADFIKNPSPATVVSVLGP